MSANVKAVNPQVLVLGPGGIRGFLQIGALMCLEHGGYLANTNRVVGVSIGAIIGLLWLAGYSAFQIAVECLDFSLLNTESSFFNSNTWMELAKITERWGAFSNSKIQQRLEFLIKAKYGFIPTIAQLYKLTGKYLDCVTVNYTLHRVEYLDTINNPNLSVVQAALMSCSIPGVMERMIVNNNVYIDGALRDPCPTHRYDDGNTAILVLYIINAHQFEDPINDHSLAGLLRFTLQAYSSTMEELYERSKKSSSDKCKYLTLTAPTLDTTGITVPLSVRITMLATGYLSALQFLS